MDAERLGLELAQHLHEPTLAQVRADEVGRQDADAAAFEHRAAQHGRVVGRQPVGHRQLDQLALAAEAEATASTNCSDIFWHSSRSMTHHYGMAQIVEQEKTA